MRQTWCSLALLAWLAPCVTAQSAPDFARIAAAPVAQITLGQSIVALNGPWKFHIGDNPAWADPNFDDSQWETVDLTPKAGVLDPRNREPRYVQGWTMKGHPGYWGYAWYRLRIPVTSAPGEKLALLTYGWVDDGYQLFDNGQLLGSWGKFRGPGKWPVVYFTQPAMFILPQPGTGGNASTGPATVELAFRCWMGPVSPSHRPFTGGLHYAPLLGEAGAITAQAHMEWLELVRTYASAPFAASLFLLLAIVAATLILFDRSDSVYLWVAGALLICGIREVFFAVSVWTRWESFRTYFFQIEVICYPLMFGAWGMVWWIWFKLRRPHWVPTAIAALTLLNMVSELPGEDLLYDLIPHPVGMIFHAASLVARLLLLAIIVFIVGKGIRERGWEGWLVLPAVVPLAFAQFQSELISRNWHGTFAVFGIVFFYSEIANLFLSAVVALLLLRRLLVSLRRQRGMALDVKQAQEVQRVLIPEELPHVPGLTIESEYRPAREVGGDFFQIIPNASDGSVLIVVGDVTGKGLQAGMLVALIVGAIRNQTDTNFDSLSMLQSLNRRLIGRGHAHATCLALRITADGAVTLANAGHLPPYLNGKELPMEGAMPLGMIEGAEFSVMQFDLAPGDSLMLLSDGIAEARDEQGQLFGFERIHEMLKQPRSAAEVATTAQDFGQQDDISVLSISRAVNLKAKLA